jgi:NADPH:quinone reductase-like Zn-dependent oxidoreductase
MTPTSGTGDGCRVEPSLWKTLPLAQARDAHEILEKNENIGKVVLVPDVTGQD